ncbi:MAG: hypothetical protein IPK64_18695 [bacterium]|nr:hypothetical protein [bacterium]
MPRFPHLVLPCALLLALALAGCGDDGPEPVVVPFALELAIRDPAGRPVPNLEAKLHVPLPGFPVSAAKPQTTIQFSIPEAAHVALNVYDLEGRFTRTLWDADMTAGVRMIAATGGQEEDFAPGSRIHRYELVATVDGTETFRDSKYMSIYTSIDVDQQPVLGISDQDGLIRFTDKTHFPFLYELGPQPMVDENGNPAGTFEFSDVAIIRLYDQVAGLYLNHEVLITDGANVRTLIWDVEKAVRDVGGAMAGPAAVAAAVVEIDTPASAAIPPLEYELRQNVPNPFN